MSVVGIDYLCILFYLRSSYTYSCFTLNDDQSQFVYLKQQCSVLTDSERLVVIAYCINSLVLLLKTPNVLWHV